MTKLDIDLLKEWCFDILNCKCIIPTLNISDLMTTNILNNKAVELQPTPLRISFPVALTSYHGFYYIVPKELESGLYEVQLIYPNGEESLKYWNKIGIK